MSPENQPITAQCPWVKDVTVHNFMDEVVAASQQTPLILNFWAPRSGPCQQLTALLESIVTGLGGQLILAKVNVDESPQIAQKFQVHSVPMVFSFFKGQPVDAFTGLIPETQLRDFCKKLLELGRGIEGLLETAYTALDTNELAQAQEIFGAILASDGTHVRALIGLARCHLSLNELEHAQNLYDQLPEIGLTPQEAGEKKALATALQLATTPPGIDLSALEKQVADRPDNLQATFDLANGLFAQNQQERAVNLLLSLLSQDLTWSEGKAKTQLLAFFEGLGFGHPLSVHGRKQLSKLLFS
jgi:putative thioredoxin